MATAPADTTNAIDLGVLADLAGYHLRRASVVFAVDFARALDGTKIRQVLFGIMSVVAANPGTNQGAVGRALGIQRANMVALVNELIELGFVERKVSTGDRRAFALTLTKAGKAMLAKCLVLIGEHEEALLADLDAAERAQLGVLLDKIAARER